MAIKIAPPEPDLPNIRKHLRTTRPLWRLCAWGGAAAIALTAVALTSQTESGSRRLQLALAYVTEPVRAVAVAQIPPRAVEPDAETKRLAAEVRALAADRERLTARIATLERNLNDMTGSIKQQAVQTAATPAVTAAPPVPSAPATTPAVIATAPPPIPVLPVLRPLAMPATTETAAAWPATAQPQAAEPAREPVPLPPVRIAAAPANEPVAEPAPPAKLEFGIDLGGAASIEALRMHWAAVKANYGPVLVGLRPVASQRLRRPAGIDYRLVAGPLPDAAAAAQLCARFPVTRTGCRPAKFNGAQLAEH